MKAFSFVLVLAAVVMGCGSSSQRSGGASGAGQTSARGAASPEGDTCMPDALRNAPVIANVQIPRDCQRQNPSPGTVPVIVHNAEELAPNFRCRNGATIAVDFDAHDLAIHDLVLSPATGGLAIADDGRTVTFVTRFRPPCPDDPHAMPTPMVQAFLLPKNALRNFAEATCSLPANCEQALSFPTVKRS